MGRLVPPPSMGRLKHASEKGSVSKSLGTIGTGLAGMGVGTLAGYGAGKGVEALLRKRGIDISPRKLMLPATIAGAGSGIAYSLWKAHEMEALKRAVEGSRDKSK